MYLLTLALSFAAFIAKGAVVLDSDLGWHLRLGEIIIKSGIPPTDPLSYSMPSYPFVDHEWLSNIILARTYPLFGLAGLAVVWAIMTMMAVTIQVPKKYRHMSLLPLLLIFGALFPFEGVRTQVVSWLLFSILVLELRKQGRHYVLVPLMLLWVNLHGSFPLGIVLFFVYAGVKLIKHKLRLSDIVVFSLLIAVTFINPYGHRIWWEVWMQMSDTGLRWSIIEWMPAFFFINLPLWMYLVVSTTLIYRYRKNYNLFDLSSYILFLIALISSYRHAPLWMILTLLPTLKAIESFTEEVSSYQYGKERLAVFMRILLVIAIAACLLHLSLFIKDDLPGAGEKRYPAKAIRFIRRLDQKGEIISIYEWGGYLNWRLPEKKVFIDGRMPSWRWKAPEYKESDNAFHDYREALYGDPKNFEKIRKKFGIKLVLVPRSKKSAQSNLDLKFEQWFIKLFAVKEKKGKKRATDSMKKIYEDNVAAIYQTKSP